MMVESLNTMESRMCTESFTTNFWDDSTFLLEPQAANMITARSK